MAKEEYRIQMLLYAVMFHEKHGEWPNKLILAPLNGDDVEIPLDEVACAKLVDEAKTAVELINDRVRSGAASDLAKPLPWQVGHPGGCGGCAFRPLCQFYKDEVKQQDAQKIWPRDVWGEVLCIERTADYCRLIVKNHNNVCNENNEPLYPEEVTVQVKDCQIRHPAIPLISTGVYLEVYNFVKRQSVSFLEEGNLTTLYVKTN